MKAQERSSGKEDAFAIMMGLEVQNILFNPRKQNGLEDKVHQQFLL